MAENSDREKLSALLADLAKVNQSPFIPDLDRVKLVYQAYQRNAVDLLRHIQVPHSDFNIAIQTQVPGENPQIYYDFHSELLRLMMNYSAIIGSLIDHTRSTMDRMKVNDPDVYQEYFRRLTDVSESSVAVFVKNLRNYMLHYDLPSIASQLSFSHDRGGPFFDNLLDVETLLTWKGWGVKSKVFMQDKESISLSTLLTDYDHIIDDLYRWLFSDVYEALYKNATRKIKLEFAIISLERRMSGK